MKTEFDWSELAFGSKKPLRELDTVFIAAPREISTARFTQLIKEYLPKTNIIIGIAKEKYVDGFESQVQFKTLKVSSIQPIINKVTQAKTPHRVYTLHYFQRELPYILEKLKPQKALFINGSWKYLFHTRTEFYTLVKHNIPYELISPFVNEAEARSYETHHTVILQRPQGTFTEHEMLSFAAEAAAASFDYGFQTGVVLGRKVKNKYDFLTSSFNKVVPYQTYAMHFGASREKHFSPMHDLNHYDTYHAEVGLMIAAQKECIDLKDTTLFINLLPCPNCTRMFMGTDIAEVIYKEDHSSGYGVKMLELAGKTVRRIV